VGIEVILQVKPTALFIGVENVHFDHTMIFLS
jgi:hypothetical protein